MIHSTFVPFCNGLWVNLHEYLRRQTFTQRLDEGMHEEENLFDVEQVLGGEPLGVTLKVLVQLGMSSLKLWGSQNNDYSSMLCLTNHVKNDQH